MKKKFDIINKLFLLDIPIECNDSYNFLPFYSDKNMEDITINFIKKDNIHEKLENQLYDLGNIKIYKTTEGIVREHIDYKSKMPFALFFEEPDEVNKYKCFLYPGFEKKIYNISNVFELIGIESILYKNNTFILHSSYIRYKNEAILFSGPSGSGKSTQAQLWEKYEHAEIINGDRTAINDNNGKWEAYGLPYAGSSNIYKNITTVIKSIVVIRQGKDNKIKRLNEAEAFKLIYSETTINIWNKDFVDKICNIILKMIKEIPIYLFYCTNDARSVEVLKNKIERDTIYESDKSGI